MFQHETPVNISNTIKIPFSVKTVYDYNGSNNWKLFTICKGGYSNDKYDVYITLYNNNIYMKPFKPYYSNEFEQLFGFGLCCSNYNSNTIITVNDKEYYKKFVKYFN